MTSMADIYRAVADEFHLDRDSLMGGARGGQYAMPRQIVAWLAMQHDIPVATIMSVMSRTRTVVLVMAGHVDTLRAVDPQLHAQTYRLRHTLGMPSSPLAPAAKRMSDDDVIRDYRRRGATIPSIAKFTGRPAADVARVLGTKWEVTR